MSVWPAFVGAVFSAAGAVGLVLAILAHFHSSDLVLWRQSAEASTALVNVLRARLEETLKEIEAGKAERETLSLRLDAMEKMVAYLERQNHLLQIQLDDSEKRNAHQHDESEARNAVQHHPRKPKKPAD